MRKFFILFVAAFVLLACTTSCKDSEFSFEYSFTIDGHADGDVSVAFPGGGLDMKGGSELEFNYSSIPTNAISYESMPLYTVQELKASNKQNYNEIGELVEDNYEAQFKATSAGGTYYLHVVGVVRERLTGLEVEIDKILTNEEPDQLGYKPDYKSER